MAGARTAARYRREALGTGIVMLAPVMGWWAPQWADPTSTVDRTVLTAGLTMIVLGCTALVFRRGRAGRWNPLILLADSLLERRHSLTLCQFAGYLVAQLGAAAIVAGVVAAGYAGAGIAAPAVPTPQGVHALTEMTAAAAAVICFFAVARLRSSPMVTAAGAMITAVLVATGSGFLGNPAVVLGAVVLGLDPVIAMVITVCQLGGCLVGYRLATVWWPDIGRRLDALPA